MADLAAGLGFDPFTPGDVATWRKVLRENAIEPEPDCEGCDGVGVVLNDSPFSLSIWDFCECVVDAVDDLSRCPNDPDDCAEPGCTCGYEAGEIPGGGYLAIPGVNYPGIDFPAGR